MYYNSNFGGQVQQPMPQQMPMYGQGPYPVMDNRLSALQMGMCQGFNQTNSAIAESRFAAQQCCCETNRNIDAVRAENYRNTCEITTAIHAEGEATRALITANVVQELRDQLQAAQLQLGNLSQTQTIINTVRPFPQPAYITCSPYTAMNGYGYGYGCGCGNACGCV